MVTVEQTYLPVLHGNNCPERSRFMIHEEETEIKRPYNMVGLDFCNI